MNKQWRLGITTSHALSGTTLTPSVQAVCRGRQNLTGSHWPDNIGKLRFKCGGRIEQTVQRLEEASISCKGPERVQLMKRWLAALKVIDNMSEVSVEDKGKNNEQQHPSEELRKQPLVLYYDSEIGGEPLNFIDVFLYSKALEGITICMSPRRAASPQQFFHCFYLSRGPQIAIGLLMLTETTVDHMRSCLTGKMIHNGASGDHETISNETEASIEALKAALAHVDLLQSLVFYSSTSTTNCCEIAASVLPLLYVGIGVSDDRIQKAEALRSYVSPRPVKLELIAEISALEKQRNEIEAQLKQVNISLAAASARLHNAREERDQFYEANDRIVAHLKTRFMDQVLEGTPGLFSPPIQKNQKTRRLFCELGLATSPAAYEKELRPSIDRIRKYADNLKSFGEAQQRIGSGFW
ncbi:hypothetical protein HAX54_051301 [Datura stramonium]|uniref:Uncharacterized protein n=1 Tax=Datura stramonium TaxID=4076 RepID=A0ABS8SXF9_DATST|nr:hypothetical protein [Datura stramonium]